MKGLKMHQRKCRVISGFNDDSLFELPDEDTTLNEYTTHDLTAVDMSVEDLTLKYGILLPKLEKDWSIANDYFHSLFTETVIETSNVDVIAEKLSNSIYDYFKINFAQLKNHIKVSWR